MRYWLVICLMILGGFRTAYAGDSISGSASLSYRSTETTTAEDDKRTWSLNQSYRIGLVKEFTPKVNFTANLGVNVNETDDTKTTQLNPDLRLNMSNEYFNADAGYRMTEKGLDILTMVSEEERFTTESLSTNFNTKSEKYPKVRLRYNEDKNYDHLVIHETDTQTNTFSGNVDYAFRFLNLYYDHTNINFEDKVADSTQETNTHEGRVDFSKSFWSNRITSTGSYSLKENKTETTTRGQDVEVAEQKSITDGLFKDHTLVADPTNIALDTGQTTLYDGDKGTSTGIEIGLASDDDQNIGLDLNFAAQIENIYVYTTTPIVGFNEDAFTWDAYWSSDNLNWTAIAASSDYDTNEKRFEISVTKKSARYFKVVNTANDNKALEVTEIEAYGATTQTAYTSAEQVSTKETVHANLGFRPFTWLSFTYDVKQDMQKDDASGADATKTRRSTENISGLLGKEFQVHKYLMVRPQYQKRLEFKDEPESETRSSTDTYRAFFSSSPLKTLDTDFSLNHSVSKDEDVTQSRNSSALLHIAAKLREGADLDIDGNMTQTENLSSDTVSTTRTLNSNLKLELTSALTTEIEYNKTWTETQITTPDPSEGTSGRTSSSKATIYWRPSHEFYLRGSFGIDRDEETGDETTNQGYNMNWLLTEKVQLSMDYTIDRSGTTVQTSYSSDLSWNLSRMFALRFRYDWSSQEAETETETQTISTDISARF